MHGLDPNDPDDAGGNADGDGYSNAEEYRLGTCPDVWACHFRSELAGGGADGLELRWSSRPGVSYVVEVSSDLTEDGWNVLDEMVAEGGVSSVAVGGGDPGGMEVFRIRVE